MISFSTNIASSPSPVAHFDHYSASQEITYACSNLSHKYITNLHTTRKANMAAELPDAAAMAQAMATMSRECAKFGNIPAVDQGTAILHALEQLGQRIERMDQRMERVEQRVERLDQRVERLDQRMNGRFNNLETRFQAMYVVSLLSFELSVIVACTKLSTFTSRNHNAIARTQNSMRGFTDQTLSALVSLSTNEDIPGFPTTPATLNRMQNATLDRVLTALELNLEGALEEKRSRLRLALGLKI